MNIGAQPGSPLLNESLIIMNAAMAPDILKLRANTMNISVSLTYFVPPVSEFEECPVELWVMKVKNLGSQVRVSAFIQLCRI